MGTQKKVERRYDACHGMPREITFDKVKRLHVTTGNISHVYCSL